MKAMPRFALDAWFFLVRLPLQVAWAFMSWVCLGWFNNIVGRGYRVRNDWVDQVLKECVELPAGRTVRLPWINTGNAVTDVLDNSGRLYAYIAVANGWFGLAEKVTGEGGSTTRSYRYYYHRDLTGNWFAEIWSIWKSGFWAALLALPFVDFAVRVADGREAEDHYGALLLMSGLSLVIFFLPRAVLGRGIHFPVISLVNGSGFGSYGCAQIINWFAGLGGVSYLWLAMGLDWNFGASIDYVASFILGMASSWVEWVSIDGWLYMVAMLPIAIVIGVLFGWAWMIIPAAFFWYVSLRYGAVRNAKAQLEALPYNAQQAKMFSGSNFESMYSVAAPQIFFGWLFYLLILFGFILFPVTSWFLGLFF